MTMRCETYESDLIDHAFGTAAPQELERHLAACERCRGRLRDERRMAAVIDGELIAGLDAPVPTSFEARVRTRIAERAGSASRMRRMAMGVGLAAALALLAIGLRPSEYPAPAPPPQVTQRAPLPESPAVREVSTPRAPARRERHVVRRAARPSRAPEVLVPPDQQIALRRLAASLSGRADSTPAAILIEPPVPFRPAALSAGALDELPLIHVTDDLPMLEPPTVLERLATGGGV